MGGGVWQMSKDNGTTRKEKIVDIKLILEKHAAWLMGDLVFGKRADFKGANLSGANLEGANLSGANLGNVILSNANLSGTNFENAYMSGVYLENAILSDAILSGADLENAVLSDAILSGANLENAILSGADLENTNLRKANLWATDIEKANLHGTKGDMYHVKSIFCEAYPVVYTANMLQIGCERHKIEEWWDFTDLRILKMDSEKALDLWKRWKQVLKYLIEMSPAEPTQ